MKTQIGFAPAVKTAAKLAPKIAAKAPAAVAVKVAAKPKTPRDRAVALLVDIKANAPKAWADIIKRIGQPPTEAGLGDAWDWLSGALNTASSALDKYAEYKKNTATWKAELEALKAQTAAANAATAAQNSGGFFPTSTGSDAGSTNYLPWIAGALGLGLLFTLRANPQTR